MARATGEEHTHLKGNGNMNPYGRFNRGYGRFGDAPPSAMPGPGAPMPGMAALPEDQYGPYTKNVKFWFTYQTPNIASIAAAASSTNSIVFDNDSAFEWTKITVFADIAGAVQTASSIVLPLATVQIQDTGQGAYYSNAPIPLACYMGQLGLPYVMPAPQIIAPNATLQFNWNNYSAATTYANLRMQLHGWKIRR